MVIPGIQEGSLAPRAQHSRDTARGFDTAYPQDANPKRFQTTMAIAAMSDSIPLVEQHLIVNVNDGWLSTNPIPGPFQYWTPHPRVPKLCKSPTKPGFVGGVQYQGEGFITIECLVIVGWLMIIISKSPFDRDIMWIKCTTIVWAFSV